MKNISPIWVLSLIGVAIIIVFFISSPGISTENQKLEDSLKAIVRSQVKGCANIMRDNNVEYDGYVYVAVDSIYDVYFIYIPRDKKLQVRKEKFK